MLIIHAFIVFLCVVLGIVFWCGKGSFLIAGYNTASPQEKAQYDEKALCRTMGGLMFAIAGCTVVMALSDLFQNMTFYWVGLALLFMVTIVGVIYMNTSKRVKRK